MIFFGCWGRPGHFMYQPSGHIISDHEAERQLLPSPAQLDGSKLFLPRPEKAGSGALTYLPAPNLTILAWWGNNPWDDRGAVNSAIIMHGEVEETVLWQQFMGEFTSLEGLLKRPTVEKK